MGTRGAPGGGVTHEIDESAQGTRVRGDASIRAEQQARQLTRETGERYTTEIIREFGGKRAARKYETEMIELFRRVFGPSALPGNKTNR